MGLLTPILLSGLDPTKIPPPAELTRPEVERLARIGRSINAGSSFEEAVDIEATYQSALTLHRLDDIEALVTYGVPLDIALAEVDPRMTK